MRGYAEVMQRILITGGAGFIGSHVADRALAAGYQVTALDNLSSGRRENLSPEVELLEVDLRDADGVYRALDAARPHVISHHAAQVSVFESVHHPHHDAQVNILGTLNLLDAARRVNVRRVIFASSGGAIHGEVPEGGRAEVDWPASPISPYAVSKLAGEGYLQAYRAQFGIEFCALRYGNVYGPRQNPHGEAGVVAVFVNHLLAGQPLTINAMNREGDDGCVRDYVYVGDVAQANLLAAGGEWPDVVNIGTGQPTTTRQLLDLLCDLGGLIPQVSSAPQRDGDIRRSLLSPVVCERLLGSMTPLREGLRWTLESFAEAGRLAAGSSAADTSG